MYLLISTIKFLYIHNYCGCQTKHFHHCHSYICLNHNTNKCHIAADATDFFFIFTKYDSEQINHDNQVILY